MVGVGGDGEGVGDGTGGVGDGTGGGAGDRFGTCPTERCNAHSSGQTIRDAKESAVVEPSRMLERNGKARIAVGRPVENESANEVEQQSGDTMPAMRIVWVSWVETLASGGRRWRQS